MTVCTVVKDDDEHLDRAERPTEPERMGDRGRWREMQDGRGEKREMKQNLRFKDSWNVKFSTRFSNIQQIALN